MRFKKYFKIFLVPGSNANVIILESSLQPSDWLDGVTAETRKCCGFLFFGLQSQSELFFIVMIGNICANEDDCDIDDGDNNDGDNDDDGDDGHLAA